MTNQAKAFIKKINTDRGLFQQFKALLPEDQEGLDRDAFIGEKILPFAKQAGFDLKVEDFKRDAPHDGEISDDELAAVAGGICTCVVVGGGGGTDFDDDKTYGCACVAYGQGGDGSIDDANCVCGINGEGQDGWDFY